MYSVPEDKYTCTFTPFIFWMSSECDLYSTLMTSWESTKLLSLLQTFDIRVAKCKYWNVLWLDFEFIFYVCLIHFSTKVCYQSNTCLNEYIYRGVMMFNATFNNISVMLWRSVSNSLVKEIWVTRENHWPAASHGQTLSHNVALSTPSLSVISNSQC